MTDEKESREIRGDAKTIRQLLEREKYAVDYYQREYKWQTKQIQELLSDLGVKFLNDYEENHEPTAVADYGHYFLGSIIISKKDGKEFVIDGQQRLTTLTLLLIYLHQLQKDQSVEPIPLENLIYSSKHGVRSFNLDVPEREECMQALFKGDETYDPTHAKLEAVKNIWQRFQDITELFPEELEGKALPLFIDWLLENVHVVVISAYSDADAYTVFETMNDRGLSLTPTEMLKGYLLSNIKEEDRKVAANNLWKEHIALFNSLAQEHNWKELDADSIKTWLRSQYARNIRERTTGAVPKDWDKIGTEFHRWVRENPEFLGITKSSDFIRFIEKDFDFYSRQYRSIIYASVHLTPGLEHIYYNAQRKFTLQYQVLLASLQKTDSEEIIRKKIRVVAKFLDILLTRRILNYHSNDYNTMQYAMFILMKEIRGKSIGDLVQILTDRLMKEKEVIGTRPDFMMTKTGRGQLHYLLARITDYAETRSGLPSRYLEYVTGEGKQKFEVEHIWADHPERHRDEFPHAADFELYRNHFGGLLLLQKSFNASFNDLPYKEKREHYIKQNLLAATLHPLAYERDPGFLSWKNMKDLPFKPIEDFRKSDIDERGALYFQIANLIWNPDILKEELSG